MGKPNTVKVKPATALPYLALTGQHSDEGRISYTHNGHQLILAHVFDGSDFASAPMNTDYLCHAANAYPKLVEALRNLLPICDNDGPLPFAFKAEGNAANALLRELGEES